MDVFLVFRCNPENKGKLLYLMIGLNCNIAIIDAIFFLALGSTFRNEQTGFTNALQFHVEMKINRIMKSTPRRYIQRTPFHEKHWSRNVEMCWNAHGSTFDENGRLCICVLKGAHWATNIYEDIDGHLLIESERGTRTDRQVFIKQEFFRFGQFNATLDTHLALMFKE
jgi:hypothetical protein